MRWINDLEVQLLTDGKMTTVKDCWLQYLFRNNLCYCLKIFILLLSIPSYNAVVTALCLLVLGLEIKVKVGAGVRVGVRLWVRFRC